MNDMTYVEAARALAERMLKQGGATDDRRASPSASASAPRARPSEAEAPMLADSLARFRQQYAARCRGREEAHRHRRIQARRQRLPAAELAAHTSARAAAAQSRRDADEGVSGRLARYFNRSGLSACSGFGTKRPFSRMSLPSKWIVPPP